LVDFVQCLYEVYGNIVCCKSHLSIWKINFQDNLTDFDEFWYCGGSYINSCINFISAYVSI